MLGSVRHRPTPTAFPNSFGETVWKFGIDPESGLRSGQEGSKKSRSAASWRQRRVLETPSAIFQTVSEGEFCEVRVSMSLRTPPARPTGPSTPCLKRLPVVAPVSPYPSVFELEDHREIGCLPAAVVVDTLYHPKPVPDQHPAQPDGGRVGVSLLEAPHVLSAPDALS